MPVRTDEPAAGTSPAGSRVPAGDTHRADGSGVFAGASAGAFAEDAGGLVERAQRGDPEAFRALYRDIQPRLLRYLHTLAGQDAEDIAAETWLQITRDLPAFAGDYDHFRGWTATIPRHRALAHLRPPPRPRPPRPARPRPRRPRQRPRPDQPLAPRPGRSRPAPRRPRPGRPHRRPRPGQTTRGRPPRPPRRA